MPTAIFTSVAENFRQITSLFGGFDEFLRIFFNFLGGTPLLKMPSTLGYYDPFLPRREGVVPPCLENDLVPLLGHTCRFGGTLPPLLYRKYLTVPKKTYYFENFH